MRMQKNVSASYGKLSVVNMGENTNLSVYSTAGSQITSKSIGLGLTTIDLPINKIYIIKVGNETFKVSM